MNRQRLFRGLRIAWTAGFAILCLLLIVLWVRSYSRMETISLRGRGANSLSIIKGSLIINAASLTFNVDDGAAIGITTYHSRKPLAGGRIFITSAHPISHLNYVLRGNGWQFPIWLLVAALVVVAALPWLPWWSTRFSLRTLLITTTLVALGLGVVIYLAR